MIEEIATVIGVEADGVWVKTQAKTTCGACQQQDSCTSGVVAKALTPKEPRLFIPTAVAVLPGQQVRIGLHETALTQAALRVYLVPIVAFMLAMGLLVQMGANEGVQLLGGLLGSGLSLLLVRRSEQKREKSLQVSLLEVLPTLAVSQQ
ncbi:MAG: SoxR reducing system RseC family protein [Gammaproteobacteria bacterium]|jgi:sigma-E factor negative regulatory protein RseC|nr:SoxR reducing system RseC family protein [Gammaproteobacteria bacterium]